VALSSGDRLGHYLISAPLGAGGMGEVYRAQDSRLGKVLPDEVAADAERLARFEREAKLLASLNHPNIATLYGLEAVTGADADTGVTTFLAMELVEGVDLEGRIAKGPIPVNEAIAIAKQIAEGLEAAHGKGIVHRDLKPANIRITPDGTVKILDFGLAKAWDPPDGEVDSPESPTITAEMTREGTILGTAPYMSPEQTRTLPTDRRTDIWAFGCVLFEMLAGRRAFPGDTWPEILAHILERDPDWDALPPTVSPGLRRLLGRCLEKEPKRRLRDAGDVALALEDLDLEQPPAGVRDTTRRASSLTMKVLPWAVAAVAAVIAIIAFMGRPASTRSNPLSPTRFREPPIATLDVSRIGHSGSAVAISPNGELLVWVGATVESTQLYLRSLDEHEARPIAGTEGALTPFFSPDSGWIGFWADRKLRKVSASGGVPQTICEIDHVHGVAWGDGIIVMGAIGAGTLYGVDPGGGQVQPLATQDGTTVWGEYPKLLPGSRDMLISRQGRNTVELVSLDTGEVTTLVSEGTNGSYLASGHLVWTQQDNLLAAPFDLSNRTITGEARTIVEGVLTESTVGVLSHYAVSDTGTLAYLPGTFEQTGARPTWVGLDGTSEPLPLPPDTYLSPRISPDGRRLLLSRQGKTRDFWLAEPDRGVMSPITGDEGEEYWGIWTPDGTGMVFNSLRGDKFVNIWLQPVDRSSPATRLTNAPFHQPPADITRDGRSVVFGSAGEMGENLDVNLLNLDGRKTTALLDSDADEIQPKLSPDERWLAYASDVTGRREVYAKSFPDMGATVRVSPNGGQEPLWSPSGDRLYYRSQNGRQVFAVDVIGDPLRFGREVLLFEGTFTPGIRWGRKWDIHPAGDRFLMLPLESAQSPKEIRVVVNLFGELERLVPSNR
jgi:serine/threonine protein kinase